MDFLTNRDPGDEQYDQHDPHHIFGSNHQPFVDGSSADGTIEEQFDKPLQSDHDHMANTKEN